MADHQKPKQRTRADWGAAKAAYVALDATERTFAGIAREFRVSSVTVRKHAHADGWVEAAVEADNTAAAAALARGVRSREQRNELFLRIADKAFQKALEKLTSDELEVRLADLPALGKHAELILGEATDRVSFSELQEALGVVMAIAVEAITGGWQVPVFLTRVRERIGAIEAKAAA